MNKSKFVRKNFAIMKIKNSENQRAISFVEFVALMALFTALTAMSIDTILPALSLIGQDLKAGSENNTQYIISTLFLGFTFGQLISGPLADSYGRKPAVYWGLAIFIIGCLICLIATNFHMMLVGRFLQGLGASAPRIISITMTRDIYKGRDMARVTSIVMAVFILVPVIAPSFGQLILFFASWHFIFVSFLIVAIMTIILTYWRLPETLKPEDKKVFNLKEIWYGTRKVVGNKTTLGYAVCAGLIFGALMGYLNLSRQIYQDYYKVGAKFSLYFSISALSIGAASVLNSAIVKRYGMRLICHYALLAVIIVTILFFSGFVWSDSIEFRTPILAFMIYIGLVFFCLGLLFGNLNAMAMEPMGHFAGIASGIIGALSSAIGSGIGTIIGQLYSDNLYPLVIGFLVLSTTAFILQHLIGSKN